MVAGVSGEDLIVEEFRKMYQTLYNSCDTSAEMDNLKDKLSDLIRAGNSVAEADLI